MRGRKERSSGSWRSGQSPNVIVRRAGRSGVSACLAARHPRLLRIRPGPRMCGRWRRLQCRPGAAITVQRTRDVADDSLVLIATVTTGDVVSTEISIFDARGRHNMVFYGGRCRCGVETIVTGSSLEGYDGRVSQGPAGRRWSHDSSRSKLTPPRSGRSCG
jgi:hypothetical protein